MFQMPKVEVGQIVHWFATMDPEAPRAALVTQVGDQTISVAAYDPVFVTQMIRDGVRHCRDPKREKSPPETGCWGHTPMTQELEQLKRDVEALKGKKG